MTQTKEELAVQIDHPIFKIMPGIVHMAVETVAEACHHDSSHNYSYDLRSTKRLRTPYPVNISATIQKINDEPPYIVRDMLLKTPSRDGGLFGRVAIKHLLNWGENGYTPEAGQVHYYDYATEMNYFVFEGSLVREDGAGKRQLVGDTARFEDGQGLSVAIDASGIEVTLLGENFADISFDQSGVSMAVANIDDGVYTSSKELYFL